ncbi:MAG: helix-turn-helix transcriptional regulator [Clostridia bacterium]|nr:helix-turn-helix transcriptional regulator [Clostridia bacterium]MBQ2255819.1 helix-turn-helix transcriptional regulator [Clostridia bacterium]MBQ5794307.1 helix-turn-helix transcriptional regulator [Clostridia bacterium]
MTDYFKIGSFICEMRKRKGLSQNELGERLHVTNKAVSRWETGRGLPDSSLLLPLAEELGVTVDEILRGELITTDAEVATELSETERPAEKQSRIAKQNVVLLYKAAKKQLIRDSAIVLPTVAFLCVWLVLVLHPDIDLAPGANYALSMWMNLLLPLCVITVAQTLYAAVLIGDMVRLEDKPIILKILICIGLWYAVAYLFLGVYLFRLVRCVVLGRKVRKVCKAV